MFGECLKAILAFILLFAESLSYNAISILLFQSKKEKKQNAFLLMRTNKTERKPYISVSLSISYDFFQLLLK